MPLRIPERFRGYVNMGAKVSVTGSPFGEIQETLELGFPCVTGKRSDTVLSAEGKC